MSLVNERTFLLLPPQYKSFKINQLIKNENH